MRKPELWCCAVLVSLFVVLPEPAAAQSFPIPADLNDDGDVDQADFASFQSVFSGPGMPYPVQGATADFDNDGDVDVNDYLFMQASFSGTDVPGDPEGPAIEPSSIVSWALEGASTAPQGQPWSFSARGSVTGNNQGLAGYVFDLELRDAAGDIVETGSLIPTDANGVPLYTPSFNFGGLGPAGVDDAVTDGGPNMDFTQPVFVDQGEWRDIGTAYRPWSGMAQPDPMLAGVGLGGGDILNNGSIDTTGLTLNETYTLTITPVGATVLRADVDLSVAQDAFAAQAAMLVGDSVTFTIVPEPVTALLLAPVLLLFPWRRRAR